MGYDDKIMLVKVHFEKVVGTMHEHYHSQVTYVESGSLILLLEKKQKL